MRALMAFVALLIVLAVAVVAWVYSGTFNVAASEPHAPWARWLIETTMRQSVRAHAGGVTVPSLADPQRVETGARLFQDHCVACHGGPVAEPLPFARAMNPEPPLLTEAVAEWTSAELFWIIKHGLKMTGMPAWGRTHADGDIWSLVAFLNQLPTMPAERYRAIVAPPAPEPPEPAPADMVPPPEDEEGQPDAPP